MYQNPTILAEEVSKKHKGITVSCPTWDSLYDVLEYGNQPMSPGWDRPSRRSRADDKSRWFGSPSWEACEKLVNEGWVKGRESVSVAIDAVWESGAVQLCSGKVDDMDVAGSTADIPSYLSGDPCYMLDEGDETGTAPVIKILVNATASCDISSRALLNRAAALSALVDVIESKGSSCEVSSCFGAIRAENMKVPEGGGSSCEKGRLWFGVVNLKAAGSPLDIDSVAFGLGHPSFLRRLMFAAMEVDPFTDHDYLGKDWDARFESGYGTPADVPKASIPGDTIYFSCLEYENYYSTPERAATAILALYNEQAAEKGLQEVGQ